MLTHRNKKPYECKAEGCGKSYCDARSLRRHTENHHNGSVNSVGTSGSDDNCKVDELNGSQDSGMFLTNIYHVKLDVLISQIVMDT